MDRRPTIQTIFAVAIAILVVVEIAVQWQFSMKANRDKANQLYQQLSTVQLNQLSKRLDQLGKDYESILALSSKQVTAMYDERTDNQTPLAVQRYLLNLVQDFPKVNAAYVGDEQNNLFGYVRFGDNALVHMRVLADDPNQVIRFYYTDEQGRPTEEFLMRSGFEVVSRSWFQEASRRDELFWGDNFQYFAKNVLAIPIIKRLDTQNANVVMSLNLFDVQLNALLTDLVAQFPGHGVLLGPNDEPIAASWLNSDNECSLTNGLCPDTTEIVRQLSADRASFTFENKEFLFVNKELTFAGSSGWRLIGLIDDDFFEQTFGQSFLVSNWLAFSMGLLVIAAFYLFMWRRLKPLEVVASYMRSLKSSDARSTLPSPPSLKERYASIEIQAIYRSLSQMVTSINSSIVERDRLLNELKRTTEQLRRLAVIPENTEQMFILVDHQGVVSWVNQAVTKYLLTNETALLDKPIFDLLPPVASCVNERKAIEKSFAEHQQYQSELQIHWRGDIHRWIEFLVEPLATSEHSEGEYFCIIRDIQSRKERDAEMLLWTEVFQKSKWGILISRGHDAMIEKANPYACELFGRPISEIIGHKGTEFLDDETKERFAELVKRANTGDLVSYQAHLKQKDGSFLPVLIQVHAVFDETGDVMYRLVHLQDMTEIEKLQRQLEKSQKLESLGLLASGIVHDFNNILGGVLLNVDLLTLKLEEKGVSEVTRELNLIKKSALNATDLVRQLLLFARRDASHFERLNVAKVLHNVESMMRSQWDQKVTLDIQMSDESLRVNGSRSQLQQLMMNLLSNAIKSVQRAMPEQPEVKVRIFQEPNAPWLVIEVSDNGEGIPESVRKSMFEPFESGDKQGTGIGLAIVKRVVEAHQGDIEVMSEVDKGTEFRVRLPLDTAVDDSDVDSDTVQSTLATERVFWVVDDDPAIGMTLSALLEKQGIQVTFFENAEQVIEKLQVTHTPPDIILSDLMMPEIDGLQLHKQVTDQYPNVRFMLMSGYLSDKDAERIHALGIRDTFSKPVNVGDIVAALQRG